jgi:hypothetical protein
MSKIRLKVDSDKDHRYIILKSVDEFPNKVLPLGLNYEVDFYLKRGWTLYGNPFLDQYKQICQAMTRD